MNPKEQLSKAFDEYSDGIFRYCFFRVFHREQAKDLTQEVFMRVWAYLAKGNKIKNIKAFLYRTARNLVIDESRRHKSESLDALLEKGYDQPVTPKENTNIELQEAMACMSRLEEEHREVISLRHIDGFSVKEIAEIVGESENVISVRIHRGLSKLRNLLTHGEKNKKTD